MRSTKHLFNFFLIGLALVLIFFGYRFLSSPDTTNDSLGLSAAGFSTDDVEVSISDEFLATLIGLQVLNLRGEVFADPVFRSLQDSNIVLVEQMPGRSNPFSPVNFDSVRSAGGSPVAVTATTTTSTSAGLDSLRAQ